MALAAGPRTTHSGIYILSVGLDFWRQFGARKSPGVCAVPPEGH